ncbi:MAG: DUF2207 domain-containing protein [Microthrixaceae bacterium]
MRRTGGGRRVLGWLVRVVVLAGVLGVLFLSPVSLETQTRDDATIVSYTADLQLSEDGDLTTVEELVVDLPPGKHGIFRIFDTADPRRDDVDHPVTVDSVERDGVSEPFTVVDGASGTMTIRIGSEGVTLQGEHTYRIVSSTVDALEADPDDEDITLWWWDVVGSGWQMPMGSARVTAELPVEPVSSECVYGEDVKCTASVEGNRMTVQTGPLEPFTPVTVRLGFPADQLPTPPGGDSSLVVTIVLSVLAGLVAAGGALWLFRATREREPGFPVLFEPPPGISPALGAKVLDETHSSNDLQATLFDLGERGLLQIAGDDDQWTVTVVGDPAMAPQWPAETAVLRELGLTQQGATFVVAGNKSSGETIGDAQRALRSGVDLAATNYLHRSGAGVLAWLLGWATTIAALVMVGVYFFADGAWVSWPLLVGCGVFSVVAAEMMFDVGIGTIRTPEGRDVWSRTGGFARFLTTDSAESRFEAAKHLDWYPRYLPWALVLGSADAWARRFESQGIATPTVPWLFWYGTTPHYSMDQMNHSFNAAISSATAAYAASQVSSGGGGGFSGGSGGGGGGGGSW